MGNFTVVITTILIFSTSQFCPHYRVSCYSCMKSNDVYSETVKCLYHSSCHSLMKFITSHVFFTLSSLSRKCVSPVDLNAASQHDISVITVFVRYLSVCFRVTWRGAEVRGQLCSLGLEKEPSCLVLVSFSCSSCLWPRRYRYSMCITSVFLIRAFSLNSSRIRGMKPGLSWPARRNCRYRARTCFCSLLCRDIRRDRIFFNNREITREQVCRKLEGHVDTSTGVSLTAAPLMSNFSLQIQSQNSFQLSGDDWSSSDVSLRADLRCTLTLKATLSSDCVCHI